MQLAESPFTNLSVAHYSSGRLRLKSIDIRRDARLGERLRDAIESVPGIVHVAIKPLSGSLLIEFNPTELSTPSASIRLLSALHEFFPAAVEANRLIVNVPGIASQKELVTRLTESLTAVDAICDVRFDQDRVCIEFDPERFSLPAVLDSLMT